MILARGFKKRPQRPTTSFPFLSSTLFSFSLVDLEKISGTHGVRVSRRITLEIPLPSSVRLPSNTKNERSTNAKRKEGQEHGDTSGEEEKDVWRKKPKFVSRVITAKSLNKHV